MGPQGTLVAAVLLPLALAAIYVGGYPYQALIILLLAVAAWEYDRLLRKVNLQPALLLILGGVLSNLTPDKDEIGHEVFANFEQAIFAVFFTVAGLELEFSYIVPGGLLALLVFSALVSTVFAVLLRDTTRQRLRFGLLAFLAFVVSTFVIGWLTNPFPR